MLQPAWGAKRRRSTYRFSRQGNHGQFSQGLLAAVT
jgi:hypothetical protein